MTNWMTEWPTERGWYWFFGQTSKSMWWQRPEYLPVQVHHDSTGKPVYVGRGGFLWKGEGARGLWTRMVLPEPPTDYQIEEAIK